MIRALVLFGAMSLPAALYANGVQDPRLGGVAKRTQVPFCTGTEVIQGLRGEWRIVSKQNVGQRYSVLENSVSLSGGDKKLNVWTCTKEGALVFVMDFGEEKGAYRYENHILARSSQFLFDLGTLGEGEHVSISILTRQPVSIFTVAPSQPVGKAQ